ncbi:hypothetical protein E2R51_02055 [Jeotgalibacillus sp. S-D1]|nr:hypothetical protein E2R51_02055 [Jeotgalibacillus sp. S-D1]
MPTGVRSAQRPANPFSSRPNSSPFGGYSPFAQQQPAQKKGLLSIFNRNKSAPAGSGNFFQGGSQPAARGISNFLPGASQPASSGIGNFLQGGGQSASTNFGGMMPGAAQPAARGIASLLGGSQGTGASGVAGALSMENIQRWVGGTQQMIQTAQQALPMIQQYGPLVRNFPAMWKLYRSLKSDDTEKDDSVDNSVSAEEDSIISDKVSSDDPVHTEPKPVRQKDSVPRLYV